MSDTIEKIDLIRPDPTKFGRADFNTSVAWMVLASFSAALERAKKTKKPVAITFNTQSGLVKCAPRQEDCIVEPRMSARNLGGQAFRVFLAAMGYEPLAAEVVFTHAHIFAYTQTGKNIKEGDITHLNAGYLRERGEKYSAAALNHFRLE